MAKGDRIGVQIRTGGGNTFMGMIEAHQNGRVVDYSWEKDGGLQWLVVQEKTRGGTLIAESRFAATEVVSFHVEKKEA